MSALTQFRPNFTSGNQRFLVDSTDTISGYIKMDGSVVSQTTYSNLYNQVGLIADGLQTWTARSSGNTSTLSGMIYADGKFVYVGQGAKIFTSTDAITWVQRSLAVPSTSTLRSIKYSDNVFVTAGNASAFGTSTDAITWSAATAFAGADALFSGLYANSLYLAGSNSSKLYTSTDLITWTARTVSTYSGSFSSALVVYGLAYFNSKYIAVGSRGLLSTSTDAVTWDPAASFGTTSTLTWYGAATSSTAVAIPGGAFATVLYSNDATTWNTVTISTTSQALYSINYSSDLDLWFVGGSSGRVFYSKDLINWTFQQSPINAIVYGADANSDTVLVASQNGNNLQTASPYSYDASTDFLLPTTSEIIDGSLFTSGIGQSGYIKTD